MSRTRDYETKVVRPVQGDVTERRKPVEGATEVPACKTCPLWREKSSGSNTGVCHGQASDWCVLHPLAPTTK